MGSIWDRPVASGDTASVPYSEFGAASGAPGPIDMVDPAQRMKGTQGGRGLLDASGRGVYRGVPLGETRQVEEEALEKQYRYRPAALARLRAATRSALGR